TRAQPSALSQGTRPSAPSSLAPTEGRCHKTTLHIKKCPRVGNIVGWRVSVELTGGGRTEWRERAALPELLHLLRSPQQLTPCTDGLNPASFEHGEPGATAERDLA